MSEVLRVDFETRSAVDLARRGVYVYAEDPTTEVLCMAYAFDDEEPELWVPPAEQYVGEDGVRRVLTTPGRSLRRRRIFEHVRRGGALSAWNAQFERVIWRAILTPRFGFPEPRLEQWYCTAADAAALALPRKLEHAAAALGLSTLKDVDGAKLMMKMCRPRKPKKRETAEPDERGLYWHDSPEMRDRLGEYCKQDVRTERAVSKRIRAIGPRERRVYLFNQRMNDRGVRVDLPLVEAMKDVAEITTRRANAELDELTGGAVEGVTRVPDLTRWLQAQGLEIDDVTKATLRDLDLTDADEKVRRVVEIRREVGKSSVKKLDAALRATCADGRARGMQLYHGASTGRDTGKLIQVHNFTRPTIKKIDEFIPLVVARDTRAIEKREPPVLVVSSMLRSFLTATPGNVLRSTDYEQIEARIVAWFAGQDDLLELFRNKGKIYETMAAFIQSRKQGREVTADEIENPSEERTLGKNTVLGCGFQMGADTFRYQAKIQGGVDISEEDAQLAVDSYRELYPRIPLFWKEINRAAIRAVSRPGTIVTCGRDDSIKFSVRGQFLWCVLPSGRPLAYARPRVESKVVTPKKGDPFTAKSVTYMGVNRWSRKWTRNALYGGKLTENVVQATARDLMMDNGMRAEEKGYPPVMTVHDEVVVDCEPGHGSLTEFKKIMSHVPDYLRDLPVSVGGWEGERYRK